LGCGDECQERAGAGQRTLTALAFGLAAGGATPSALPAAQVRRGFVAAVLLLAAAAAATATLRGDSWG
jgi:hypothetical protein